MKRPSRELQREWDAKLRASGFVDIESPERKGATREQVIVSLTKPSHVVRGVVGRGVDGGGAEYFRRAGQWLWWRVWQSRLARRTWELHAEGQAVKESVRNLGTWRGGSERKVNGRLIAERKLMLAAVARGELDDPDGEPLTLLEQELQSFDYITRRGEGRGGHGGGLEG